MSFQAMPFLFLNMGGEMAYILEQRLQAQNVGDEKTMKVLCEIVAVMLSKSFLDELFEPREMYTRQGLRQHFEQIAHSSVMRLNEASMVKLFDLMTMAVKYQFLLCKEPSEIVLVTMNHLDGMKTIFKDHQDIIERIDHASNLLMDHFGDTPLWQMSAIRCELLNFLSGTRVKVSLMLREHRQLDDGRFVLFPEGEQIELPYNAVVPGTVRYVENGALVRSEQFPVDEQFKISPDFYQMLRATYRSGQILDRTMIRGTTLGQNMYKIGGEEAVPVREALVNVQQMNAKKSKAAEDEAKKAAVGGTGDELDLLSLLIKGDRSKTIGEDGFDLELFDQDDNNNDNDGEEQNVNKGKTTTAQQKANKRTPSQPKESSLSKAMKEMDLDRGKQTPTSTEKPPSRKGSRKGAHLLEMMDQETAAPKTAQARKGSVKRGN
ncbi:hypothetical protein niasHS_011496 [Heterodera schachtii]|uniref:Protein OSCP1 n=1 Tax=Heterodera schachtii TaxID=97005 RepID=A0ABD2I8N0_HETSC